MTLKELCIRLIDEKVKFSVYDYAVDSVLCTNKVGQRYFVKILDDHILCISEYGRKCVVITEKDDLSETDLKMMNLRWWNATILSKDELLDLLT